MSPAKAVVKIRFPRWVPSDAQECVEIFYKICEDGFREVRYMLQRVATRPQMRNVWAELKHFKEFKPDRLVTWTFLTWLFARKDRPLGQSSKPIEPTYRELAWLARIVARAVASIDPTIGVENEITDTTLTELCRVANFFRREAEEMDRVRNLLINTVPPPRKKRAQNADQIAFVNGMCDLLSNPPRRRRPYALVANLTNVAFDVPEDKGWNANRVKKCYRSPRR
jgi:hypothetical protein